MQNELWTFGDFQNGDCELHMVNTPKPEPEPPADQEQSSADAEPELLSDDMFEHEFAEYRRNRTEYKARNPPALTVKLLATAEDRRVRAAIKPSYAVEALTPRIIASMKLEDLKKFVLHRTLAQMTEDAQAAALASMLEPK